MRIIFYTAIIFLCANNIGRTQDLVVLDKGDSLNCKITKIKGGYIYFTFKYENEIRNTLSPVSKIRIYQRNYFEEAEVPADKIKNIESDHQKFRIGIFGGWSYMIAKVSNDVPPDFRDYIRDLKSGYHFGGDAAYFISDYIGFGVKYSMFKTKNQLNNIYTIDTITHLVRTGMLKDDIRVQFFGPSFYTRFNSANKNTQIITDVSLGYLAYKNNATVIDNFTLTSGTVGLFWELGADFTIERNLSLGLSFSFILGSLDHYDYDDGKTTKTIKFNEDNLESISRVDLSVGLKWNLK